MSDTLTTPSADTDPAADWARPVLERQLWMLGQLAEVGLEMARAIGRQATQAEPPQDGQPACDAFQGDLPLAYGRVARAVRLTLALQTKVVEALQALDRREAHEASCAQIEADLARPDREDQRKDLIEGIVRRVSYRQGQEADERERVSREVEILLEHDEIYGDVLSQPASTLIARICRDLGLEPNWPDLAQEAWAQAEMASGAVGPPLAGLMRRGQPCAAPLPLRADAASP